MTPKGRETWQAFKNLPEADQRELIDELVESGFGNPYIWMLADDLASAVKANHPLIKFSPTSAIETLLKIGIYITLSGES